MVNIFGYIWTSFIANLGGKPTKAPMDSKQSYKITIFTTLICGAVIWISYRSFLISVLSIAIKSLPFTDLKSFYETDWR